MFKKFYIHSLTQLKQAVIKSAIYSFIFDILLKIIIKPSAVIRDDNSSADLYSIGKKDNSKGIVITNKKLSANFKPLIFFGITAFITTMLLNKLKK